MNTSIIKSRPWLVFASAAGILCALSAVIVCFSLGTPAGTIAGSTGIAAIACAGSAAAGAFGSTRQRKGQGA